MALIPFPNIPALPGVPALPRLAGAQVAGQVVLGAIQGAVWSALQIDTRWGIFDKNGKALADPSQITGIGSFVLSALGLGSTLSTVSVDYGKETQVSDFPVERGFFASYNKVQTPGQASVAFAFSGSESQRSQFIDAIDEASKSIDLYDVMTPEVTYKQYSIESYNYQRRADRGATLLIVELRLKEIRQVSAQYANTETGATSPANPDADAQVNAGRVQSTESSQATASAAGGKVGALAQ